MSYSFNARGTDVAGALADFSAKFDEMVKYQPNHAHDKAAAEATAKAMCSLCVFPDDKDVRIDAFGSLGWDQADGDPIYRSANVGCSVYAVSRETP